MKRTKLLIGYTELSIAQFCLAINIILGKLLAPAYPIFSLLALRFLIGFLLIGIYLACTYSQETCQELKTLQKRDWCILLLQALCGGFLFNALTLYGLQFSTATTAGIINSTIPAFVALFSFLILKEVLSKRTLFSIILTVSGVLIMSLNKTQFAIDSAELYGLFILCLAILPASLFTIFAKMTKASLNPMLTTALVNLINIFFFVPLAFCDDWHLISTATTTDWLQMLCYGLSGSVLFFLFWYKGLKYVTANISALFIGLTPVFTTVLAYLFLQERLGWFDLGGMICVITSIAIGTLKFQKKPTNKHRFG